MQSEIEISNFLKSIETKCYKTTKRTFFKGETITTYLEKRNQLCILLTGEADLIRYDFEIRQLLVNSQTIAYLVKHFILQIQIMNFLFLQKPTVKSCFFLMITFG